MRLNSKALILLLILGVLALLGGCTTEEGSGKVSSSISSLGGGHLEADPEPVIFPQVAKLGTSVEKSVELTNTSSTGDLQIIGLQLIESADKGKDDIREFSPGKTWLSFKNGPKVLQSGEKVRLDIKYTAKDRYSDTGVLRIYVSGDPNLPKGFYEVPLQTLSREPDIDTINPVSFPRVPVGMWACRDVQVKNVGYETLKVQQYALQDPNHYFIVKFFDSKPTDGYCESGTPSDVNTNHYDEARNPAGVYDFSQQGPLSIAPNKSFYIRYITEPNDSNKEEAQLNLETNRDGSARIYTININTNLSQDCLKVEGLNFGEVEYTVDSKKQPLKISNSCASGNVPVEIRNIRIDKQEAKNCVGPISKTSFFSEVNPPTFPLSLNVGESKTFDLEFKPEAAAKECDYLASLIVETNDPVTPIRTFPISAKTVKEAKVVVSGCVSDTQSDSKCNTSIELEYSQSGNIFLTAKNLDKSLEQGRDLKWEWTGTGPDGKPLTSFIEHADSAEAKLPRAKMNLMGIYIFNVSLTLTDKSNPSKKRRSIPVTLYVNVQPKSEIYVELTWVGGAAANKTPIAKTTGPDLDLYVVHGCNALKNLWDGVGLTGVYSRSPDYSRGSLKMQLQIDDMDGDGPEGVTITNPGVSEYFRIGVNYASSNNWGPAYAVIRIWMKKKYPIEVVDPQTKQRSVELKERSEIVYTTLGIPPRGYLTESEDAFWYVAQVRYDFVDNSKKLHLKPGSIITVNEFFENIAEANKSHFLGRNHNSFCYSPPTN